MKAFRWWETDNHPSFPLKFQLTPVGSHLSLLSHFLSIFHSQLPALLTSSQHQVKEHRLYINLSILRKRRKWQPTPIFLRGEFHGQGSLAGYSLWGHKESYTTERPSLTHSQERVVSVMHWGEKPKRSELWSRWVLMGKNSVLLKLDYGEKKETGTGVKREYEN